MPRTATTCFAAFGTCPLPLVPHPHPADGHCWIWTPLKVTTVLSIQTIHSHFLSNHFSARGETPAQAQRRVSRGPHCTIIAKTWA